MAFLQPPWFREKRPGRHESGFSGAARDPLLQYRAHWRAGSAALPAARDEATTGSMPCSAEPSWLKGLMRPRISPPELLGTVVGGPSTNLAGFAASVGFPVAPSARSSWERPTDGRGTTGNKAAQHGGLDKGSSHGHISATAEGRIGMGQEGDDAGAASDGTNQVPNAARDEGVQHSNGQQLGPSVTDRLLASEKQRQQALREVAKVQLQLEVLSRELAKVRSDRSALLLPAPPPVLDMAQIVTTQAKAARQRAHQQVLTRYQDQMSTVSDLKQQRTLAADAFLRHPGFLPSRTHTTPSAQAIATSGNGGV